MEIVTNAIQPKRTVLRAVTTTTKRQITKTTLEANPVVAPCIL